MPFYDSFTEVNMDVKENIAKNIVLLRKSHNLKQSDLAEKLHYTDKAISKWERNESTPDVEALVEIAKIFNVQIEFLFNENSEAPVYETPTQLLKKYLSLLILTITTIFSIATVIFVYAFVRNVPNKYDYWVAFIWANFVAMLFFYIFIRRLKVKYLYIYILSGVIWSFLATAYFQTLVFGENVWMIFLVGAPLQVGLFLNKLLNK